MLLLARIFEFARKAYKSPLRYFCKMKFKHGLKNQEQYTSTVTFTAELEMHLMLFKRTNWLEFKVICLPSKPRAKQRKETVRVMLAVRERWRWGINWEWDFLEKSYRKGQAHMDYVTSFSWRRSTERRADLRCLPRGGMICLFLEPL